MPASGLSRCSLLRPAPSLGQVAPPGFSCRVPPSPPLPQKWCSPGPATGRFLGCCPLSHGALLGSLPRPEGGLCPLPLALGYLLLRPLPRSLPWGGGSQSFLTYHHPQVYHACPLLSAAVEGFNFAHFGSQFRPCILNNLNKSSGCNSSAIPFLSLVHWAAGPRPGGELEPRAPSELGRGRVGGRPSPPQKVMRAFWYSPRYWYRWATWQEVSQTCCRRASSLCRQAMLERGHRGCGTQALGASPRLPESTQLRLVMVNGPAQHRWD